MTVRDPGLSTIQESGQHNSFVYTDLRVFFEVVILPDTSVWSAECTVLATVCLGQPVINFFVNLGVRRDHAPQVAEVVDNLQFCLFDGNAWWTIFVV